jgi:hypothetical protein
MSSDEAEINKTIMEKFFEDGRTFAGAKLDRSFEEARQILIQRRAAEGNYLLFIILNMIFILIIFRFQKSH